jgi:hypothetical protein
MSKKRGRHSQEDLPWIISVIADRGNPVDVVPGVVAFETITFKAWVERNDYGLEGRLVLDDPPSRYLLDRFTMQRGAESEEPITATGIRSVPIDFVISQVLQEFGVQADADWSPEEGGENLRQRGLDDEWALQRVAEVYLTAGLRRESSLAKTAQYLDCSVPTVSRWVAAAKDAGFLRVASRTRRD